MKWFSIEKYLTEKSAFENDLQRRLFYTRLYIDANLAFSLLTLISRAITSLPYSHDLRRAVGTAVTMVAMIACASIAIRVFRRQRTINTILWLNLVAVLFFIFLREGAFSPFVVGVPVVVFLAGFLIRPVYSIVFSIIAVAGYCTIVIGQASGWIPQPLRYQPQEVPLAGIILVCSAFLVTAFIGWVFAEGLLRRRRAKEESERRYRLLVDSLPDPVLLLDRSATVLHANPAALNRFGYRQEELVGQPGSIFLPPAGKIENFRKILDDFRAGRARIFETEMITQTGERFLVEVNSSPIMENGGVESVIAIFREITDRKRIEAALKASEELYRTLAETSQDYIFIVGKDLKVRYINSFGASKTGLSAKDQIGMPLEKIFPPETFEQQKASLERVFDSREPLSIVSCLRFPTSEVWTDTRLIPLKNANGEVDAVLGVTRDVTEWRRMEDALRASEKLYRSLSEEARDYIYIIDRDLKFKYMNTFAAREWGVPKDEIVGKPVETLFLPNIYEAAKVNMRKVFDTGQLVKGLERIVYPRGEIWADTKLIPLKNEKNEVESILGVTRDISEYRKAEDALRESEERYRNLVEMSPDAIILTDPMTSIIKINKAAAFLFGFNDPEDAVGLSGTDFISSQDVQRAVLNQKNLIKAGKSFMEEYRLVKKDKSEFLGEIIVSPLTTDKGKLSGYLCVIRDITEKKRAEEALRQSEQRYRTLVETSPDAICVTDLNAKIVMVNDQCARLVGFDSPEQMIGLNGYEMMIPESRKRAFEEDSNNVLNQKPATVEYTIIRKDGSNILGEVHANLLTDADGKPSGFIAVTRDITEKKRAEESLRESEQRYRSLIEASPDAIILSDMTARVIMANRQAAIQQHVDNADKLFGIPLLDFIAPDDKQDAGERLERLTKSGDVATRPYNIKRRDGSTFVGEISGITLKDAKGNPQGILTFVRDVTERKRAEDNVRESEERYRRLFDDAPYGIILSDRNLKIAMANKQAALNYLVDDPERLVGMGIFDFIITEEQARAAENIKKTFQEGKVAREEYRILREDGSTFLAEVSGATIKDPNSDVPEVLLFIRDITLRREAENKIRESEERYRRLVEASPDAIVVTDANARVIMANQQAAIMYGVEKAEDLLGLSTFDFIAPEERQRAIENSLKVLKEGSVVRQEYKVLRKDGTTYIGEINANLMKDAKGNPLGFVGVTRDITERKRIQEQLILADRMASLGQLVTGIAHEFNNVMAGLRGYAQLALMPGKENRMKELPDMVIEMVDRGQAVTENLLGFSERFYPSIETVRPSDYIQSILKLIRKDLEMGRINVEMKVPRDFTFQTDGSKFQQVLLNLIANARHAMPDGGTLSFNLSEEEGEMRLRVSDTGTGIPQESLKRVFEPFFTTKGPLGGSSLPGTGLGLSLSYGIIQSLGGNIEVESKVGEGSTFSIVLPLQKA